MVYVLLVPISRRIYSILLPIAFTSVFLIIEPYEYIYQLIESGELKEYYDIEPEDSWVVAACHKKYADIHPGLGGFHSGQSLCS
jgi:hypothetical protein